MISLILKHEQRQLVAEERVQAALASRRLHEQAKRAGSEPSASAPPLLSCCIPEPGVHFELTELRSGRALVGARWTKKSRMTYNRIHSIPYGDTIEFLERAPLQVRKDMLAIAFYRLALAAAAPVISSA